MNKVTFEDIKKLKIGTKVSKNGRSYMYLGYAPKYKDWILIAIQASMTEGLLNRIKNRNEILSDHK